MLRTLFKVTLLKQTAQRVGGQVHGSVRASAALRPPTSEAANDDAS